MTEQDQLKGRVIRLLKRVDSAMTKRERRSLQDLDYDATDMGNLAILEAAYGCKTLLHTIQLLTGLLLLNADIQMHLHNFALNDGGAWMAMEIKRLKGIVGEPFFHQKENQENREA